MDVYKNSDNFYCYGLILKPSTRSFFKNIKKSMLNTVFNKLTGPTNITNKYFIYYY